VKHAEGFAGAVAAFVERIRSGDLGALPVIVGLIIIWTVFNQPEPGILSADNLVNLLFDCSTTGVIALGIVCVLMLGQDRPVGRFDEWLCVGMVGMLWVNQDWPLPAAIVVALGWAA